MATYSFTSVHATLVTPTGTISIGSDAGVGEEGITVEPAAAKNQMTIGADGRGMHSLIANNSGTITVRLLKTSAVNARLQAAFNLQTQAPATHGKNVLVIRNTYMRDVVTATDVAFGRQITDTYAMEGGINEWVFESLHMVILLGDGAD